MSAPTAFLSPDELFPMVESVISTESDMIANMANISALIFEALPNINWAGFYLWKEDQLVLGPFQGRLACTRIPLGKGVCGTVAKTLRTEIVPDVDSFSGHIACDSASKSEIVIPILKDKKLIAVLDIDSPIKGRFSDIEIDILQNIVSAFEKRLTNL